MERIKEIIIAFIKTMGMIKIFKLITAMVFATLLIIIGGLPIKLVGILLIIGFFKCILF